MYSARGHMSEEHEVVQYQFRPRRKTIVNIQEGIRSDVNLLATASPVPYLGLSSQETLSLSRIKKINVVTTSFFEDDVFLCRA